MNERLADAVARLHAIAARERARPEIAHGMRWWIGDGVAPLAVVLLHGFTNAPVQYDRLGEQLHARGHAVIVPRMPLHGYRDRMTTAIARLRASDLEDAALRAVAIAALCGERVAVAGISVGATLAAWLATRVRIDTAVAIAPFCGLRQLPGGANEAFATALRAAPNRFLWWDPRVKMQQAPAHAYPRFSTRALGESMRVSSEIDDAPRGPHARRLVLVLNGNEPVVNNAYAERVLAPLAARGIDYERVVLPGLPPIHDVIEPAIPQAATEVVYPPLMQLIEGEMLSDPSTSSG